LIHRLQIPRNVTSANIGTMTVFHCERRARRPSCAFLFAASGSNQPVRGRLGEFFPPTPRIPGAVTAGFQPLSFDPRQNGNCGANEFDVPPAGAALWLMAEQVNRQSRNAPP
jgi:hypothetical protein